MTDLRIEQDQAHELRFAVWLPTDDEWQSYTRVAAIMAWLIGVPGLRDGSDATTYLWQWNLQGDTPYERENTGYLIDPKALREKYPSKWIVFDDFVGKGRKRETPKPTPTTGDDLFQWGGL